MTGANLDWVEHVLGEKDPSAAWQHIFSALRDSALLSAKHGVLDRTTVAPDRLLAGAAWTLWEQFHTHAPSAVDELKRFWIKTSSSGTAVLILDGLSLRELPYVVAGCKAHNVEPLRIEALASQVPTETDWFAKALGISGRSKLFNNGGPSTFIFSGPDTYTNVLDAPFADCVPLVPASPRIFMWHKWPDEPLIHLHEAKEDGAEIVASHAKEQLQSKEFWSFIDRLRQGRRLVITSDHGYAVSRSFSDEVRDTGTVDLLRSAFGARRTTPEQPAAPWPRRHLPPLVVRANGQLVVIGQRKWTVQSGFPHLSHGGLSLLEAVVPFVEFPPK